MKNMVFCINDGWNEAAAFCTMNGKNCSFFSVSICRSYSLLKMNKSQKGIIFLINNVTVTKQYFSDDCLLCLYEGSAVHFCLERDVFGSHSGSSGSFSCDCRPLGGRLYTFLWVSHTEPAVDDVWNLSRPYAEGLPFEPCQLLIDHLVIPQSFLPLPGL